MRNFNDFTTTFDSGPQSSAVSAFYSTLNLRCLIADDIDDRIVSQTLGEHRDRFRALLKKRKVLKNITSASPLMVCDYVAETVSRELTYCFT
jgi:hypothetical protein